MKTTAQIPSAVYRCFCADGSLLYVGMTVNPQVRFAAHRGSSAWWESADPDLTTVTWYHSRREAAAAELAAIDAERPRWNRRGVDGYWGGRGKTVLDEATSAQVARVVGLAQLRDEADAEYKKLLAALVDTEGEYQVPVAHMADQLGVERKTVYRHTGRSMT